MFSSDQRFVVSGDNRENLREVLKTALFLEGSQLNENETKIKSFCVHPQYGLVFGNGYSSDSKEFTKYPMTVSLDVAVGLIEQYLHSKEANELRRQIDPEDGDGGIHEGWEIYIPPFAYFQTIIAIKPSWTYYAK